MIKGKIQRKPTNFGSKQSPLKGGDFKDIKQIKNQELSLYTFREKFC